MLIYSVTCLTRKLPYLYIFLFTQSLSCLLIYHTVVRLFIRSLFHSLPYSLHAPQSLIRSFTNLTPSMTNSQIHSLIYLLSQLIHCFLSLTYSLRNSLTQPYSHSRIYSLSQLLFFFYHLPIHSNSLTQTYSHSLIYSPTHSETNWNSQIHSRNQQTLTLFHNLRWRTGY